MPKLNLYYYHIHEKSVVVYQRNFFNRTAPDYEVSTTLFGPVESLSKTKATQVAKTICQTLNKWRPLDGVKNTKALSIKRPVTEPGTVLFNKILQGYIHVLPDNSSGFTPVGITPAQAQGVINTLKQQLEALNLYQDTLNQNNNMSKATKNKENTGANETTTASATPGGETPTPATTTPGVDKTETTAATVGNDTDTPAKDETAATLENETEASKERPKGIITVAGTPDLFLTLSHTIDHANGLETVTSAMNTASGALVKSTITKTLIDTSKVESYLHFFDIQDKDAQHIKNLFGTFSQTTDNMVFVPHVKVVSDDNGGYILM
ncbi:MAG: hypothetical protein V4538_02495 [Bacteroidota bacterium]